MLLRSVVFGNVRGTRPYMDADAVFDDLNELRSWGTLIGLNEMWNYSDELAQVFPHHRWHLISEPGESPALALRRDRWNVHAAGFRALHGPVSGPPWRRVVSDSRPLLWARVSPEGDPGSRFLVIVAHFTPSAFEGRLPRRWKSRARDAWDEGLANVLAQTRDAIASGMPVLILGDWNAKHRPLGTELDGLRVRNITAANGIDKFILVDSREREWVINPRSLRQPRLNSDHDGLRAQIKLARKVGR